MLCIAFPLRKNSISCKKQAIISIQTKKKNKNPGLGYVTSLVALQIQPTKNQEERLSRNPQRTKRKV